MLNDLSLWPLGFYVIVCSWFDISESMASVTAAIFFEPLFPMVPVLKDTNKMDRTLSTNLFCKIQTLS